MMTAAMARPNQTQLQPNKATAKRSAQAFFLPFFIQAILPKTKFTNSSFITPIQKAILDFHSNFNKIGNFKAYTDSKFRKQINGNPSTFKNQIQMRHSVSLWV